LVPGNVLSKNVLKTDISAIIPVYLTHQNAVEAIAANATINSSAIQVSVNATLHTHTALSNVSIHHLMPIIAVIVSIHAISPTHSISSAKIPNVS
jgi:hypothetical protein